MKCVRETQATPAKSILVLGQLSFGLRAGQWDSYARGLAVNLGRAKEGWHRLAKTTFPIRLKEWLYERSLQRKLDDLEREWAPRLFDASREGRKSQQAYEWYEDLLAEFNDQVSQILDELHRSKSSRVLRHARRWGIEIPPRPVTDCGWTENEAWEKSNSYGYTFLSAKGMREIKQKTSRERKQFVEFCSLPFAWLIAFLGLLLALRN